VIGKPGDGASPQLRDRRRVPRAQDCELYDTMKTGMGARSQPLLLVITTAGGHLRPVLPAPGRAAEDPRRRLENDQRFGIIFTIDEDDDWTSEALVKANPNYGISVDAEFLAAAARCHQTRASRTSSRPST
jgi:phage terminase large subunit-like protein